MEIIDNFNLSARWDPVLGPWLERLITRVKSLSRKDYVVRLTGNRTPEQNLRYELYNSQAKTYVAIQHQRDAVCLQLFQRTLPDPEFGFKPGFSTPEEHSLSFDDKDLKAAAAMVQKHLDQDTPYATNSVKRIRVTPTATVTEPWTFCGGQVTSVINFPDVVKIETDHGKNTYLIPAEKMANHRPGVMKYVVFNEDGDFAFIISSEFDIYFEMKK